MSYLLILVITTFSYNRLGVGFVIGKQAVVSIFLAVSPYCYTPVRMGVVRRLGQESMVRMTVVRRRFRAPSTSFVGTALRYLQTTSEFFWRKNEENRKKAKGGGGAFVGGGAAAAAVPGGGAAAVEAPATEEKKEEKEEIDDDMGFSLFD
ncbi:hypothetical protein M9H77_12403 [Catharanthus roseus]|uniref:Uncharacterized protein n=1 Tax=Catharanthus roseus TaxID=4058 RepID=A0ACC0BHI1_CATRO|nr:hypothetical protein M9H77_12403 [Catharanthus roseus]